MQVIQVRQISQGRGSATINGILIAMTLSEKYHSKVLLISDESAADYLGLGYDSEQVRIFNFIRTNTLDGVRLERYSSGISPGVNYLQMEQNKVNDLEALLRAAKESFDYVVLDLSKRLKVSHELIRLDCLPQCDRVIENYFDNLRSEVRQFSSKHIQVIGAYQDSLKHYRMQTIKKIYKHKCMYGVPFDSGLHKACMNRSLKNYAKKIVVEKSGPLFKALDQITTCIEKLELEDAS